MGRKVEYFSILHHGKPPENSIFICKKTFPSAVENQCVILRHSLLFSITDPRKIFSIPHLWKRQKCNPFSFPAFVSASYKFPINLFIAFPISHHRVFKRSRIPYPLPHKGKQTFPHFPCPLIILLLKFILVFHLFYFL